MRRTIRTVAILCTIGFMACDRQPKSDSESNLPVEQNVNDMNSYISLFEIPAIDISRAINFYETILDLHIEKMEVDGMEMGILPYEGQVITGIIIKGPGTKPSADGVCIYLNGGSDLQVILNKVEENGGKIVVPKTPHADGSGFFALFLDTEGNKLGLNSPN